MSRKRTPAAPLIDLPLLERMVLCRQFELLVERLALQGEIRGMAHLGIGQEAIAAGIAALLEPRDWVNGTYRNVSLALCLGVSPEALLAELLGKSTGLCGGLGGHMHLFDLPRRFLGTDPIVGAGMALAAGAGLSLKQRHEDGVAVTLLGDGALGAGIAHEVLNIAKLWSLPVLFVVENNGYAISTPTTAAVVGNIVDRAESYHMPARSVDGNDVRNVQEGAAELITLVRNERMPALLEAKTYRQRGHSKSDARNYRSKEEEQKWLALDPLPRLAASLDKVGALPPNGLAGLSARADVELNAVLERVRGQPAPKELPAWEPKLAAPAKTASKKKSNRTRTISYRQAINEALADALAGDERVIFAGQDIGVFGGAYKASVELQQRFGKDRVIDTPIAEQGVCQLLVGAAMTGLRPIFEVMFGDFLALCADAIINHAAKFRYISNGQVTVPLIVRAPYGPGNGFGATHSQAVERWFAHVPGLIVAVPATPADVKAMYAAALRSDDPVLLLEPISLYANAGTVPDQLEPQLTGARVVCQGSRVTVATYGRALFAVLAARDKMADPAQIEVLDLRCLQPLDRATILQSARKTGALLVVEDDQRTFGIGGEVIASVVEGGIALRRAYRLCGADVPVPFSAPLEGAAFPNSQLIQDTLRQMLD